MLNFLIGLCHCNKFYLFESAALKNLFFQMGLLILDHCASEVGRSVPRLSFFPSWLLAEFSTLEVTIFGMGTERLRFLRGGSVVRPHVMPFNLEWMKNMYQTCISFRSFRYFNLLCFDGKISLSWLNSLCWTAASSLVARAAAVYLTLSLSCCVLTQNLDYAVKFEFATWLLIIWEVWGDVYL